MEAVVGVVSENGSADWSVREPIGTCQRLKVELLFVGLFFFVFFFVPLSPVTLIETKNTIRLVPAPVGVVAPGPNAPADWSPVPPSTNSDTSPIEVVNRSIMSPIQLNLT